MIARLLKHRIISPFDEGPAPAPVPGPFMPVHDYRFGVVRGLVDQFEAGSSSATDHESSDTGNWRHRRSSNDIPVGGALLGASLSGLFASS